MLPGMAVTVTLPQEEATDVVILSKSALSFDADNSAYVLMQNADGNMQKTAVTVGVSNDNYAEITSGLNEDDTVYVEKKTATDSTSGLNSILSMFSGGNMPSAPSGGDFNPGSFGGGNFGGGNGGGSRGSGGNRP